MSSTRPRGRPASASIIARSYSGERKYSSFMGEWMLPGAIALTRTPRGANSTASDFTSCSIAPFVAQ